MKKVTNLEIIEEIYKRQDEIISSISRESVDVYLWLKDEYKKGNVKDNLFQFVFRSFYGLDNAGLTNKQKMKYFELLANKETNLETILHELYELPTLRRKKSIQFSFTTKLLHTIDNSKPIFDKEVSAVIHKTRTGNNKEEKIKSAKNLYAYLEDLYPKLIGDKKVQKVINKFRSKSEFGDDAKTISDQKVLDFLIWSLGKLKRKKKDTLD